ncbi:adaptin AP complex subunit alpha ARM repeats [Cryptosporidium sp. chipmunk genotype I]|uniref:adaptin AP complex subunit alpha ARM repeats n=1 Tax=Cryptosporidium sp. chipmunk genotype I TaxID=1280935 RepID=UPI00351A383E|nr:adaptin AP complex subunit alpha ARM repeats [Cryptosporidium sp. chipmunk genotype I]
MELVEYEISNLKSILGKTNDSYRKDRQLTLKDKEKIIWRLAYINVMGYEIDFGWLEILELVSSDVFEFKQCGYIAASIIYRGNLELLRLLINTIKSDLNNCFEVLMGKEKISDKSKNFSPFSAEIGKNYSGKNCNVRKQKIKNCLLALNFIGNSATLDFADNLFIDVKKLAEIPVEKQFNDTHIVRSKAICCLTKLFQCCPDRLRAYEWGERLIKYFQFERSADCLISQCVFIRNSLKYYASTDYLDPKENFEKNPNKHETDHSVLIDEREIIDSNLNLELVRSWEFIVPNLIFTLSRVRLYKEVKNWRFHKIPMFWLQVKLIGILQLFPEINNDYFVNYKINKIMEDVFFNAIHAIKSVNEYNSNFSSTCDEIEFQCIIGIAVEMTKYINRTYNQEFPANINHLMGKFIEGLLYIDNKDYISISISLIFESKTNRAVEELIKKNLVALLRFICSIDEDATLNLLNIFSYVCNKNNWVFITKEILNGVICKYILNSDKLNNKEIHKIQKCSSDFFFPAKAKTLLEEIILSVCYTIRRFSNKNEVSFKTINILFQILEKSLLDPNPGFDEITENTLFQLIDILFDSRLKNESTDLTEKANESLGNEISIQRYVTIKSYKLLNKLKNCDHFNPRSGIRWLCFILGEYGQLISNKVSIIQQVEVLLIVNDTLSVDSNDDQIPLIKSTILLSFTKLYCNSDHDTQNQIYEVLKIGVGNRGNCIDSPEFLNAIIANTQYSITPINGNITPVDGLSQNNSSLRCREQLLNGVFIQKNSFLVPKQFNKYTDDGYCSRNSWLSLCLSNKGILYNFSLLSIGFSNGNFKYSSGESTIIVKMGKDEKKNRKFNIERISTLCEEKKLTTKSSNNSFPNIFDSTSQNLHVEISNEKNKSFDNEGTFEKRINLICNGPYLNPPMISLLVRVVSNSKDEILGINEKIEEIDADSNYSKLICINFRLPVILTNFMAPTKKMGREEFEHFWEKLTQSSVKGILGVSSFEIPIYMQLLNFCIYSAIDNLDDPNVSNSMIYSGTSTLYLSSRKRIPCMLKIIPCDNKYNESCGESKINAKGNNEKSIEIRVRSSSLIVAKILKQIISTYIISNFN